MIAEKAFGSATLRVVYEERDNGSQGLHTFIITAMWK
jgi:hypothetical protein